MNLDKNIKNISNINFNGKELCSVQEIKEDYFKKLILEYLLSHLDLEKFDYGSWFLFYLWYDESVSNIAKNR